MKMKLKLMAALSVLLLFMVLVFFAHHAMEVHRQRLLIQSELEDESAVFEKIVELKGKSLQEVSMDYTTWDEMGQFIARPDPGWAKENLDNALTTFSASAIWIYRPDGTLCYRTPAAESPDYSVAEGIKTSLPQLFARGPLVHFFTRCSEGIMEIRGATVHPSADLNRQSAALGYFFVGRVWTDRVAGELSRLIDGRVSLVPPQFDEVRPAFDFQKGKMLFHILLRDEVAHPLAAVRVELSLKAYFVAEQLTQRFLLVICLVVPLFFVLFYLLLARWIHRPVSRIVRALNEGRTDVLEELKNAQDELGDVARLIIRFTIQQKLLSTEVCERRQTEAQLKISQKRFRDIVDNAMEWIWEVDAQGRFTYVSPAMLKALGYDLQEVIGRNLYEFFHPEGLERQKHNMEELFDRHEAFGHLESCCRRKDNTNAWILTSAVPMTAENGRFGGYRGVFTDITQLKVTQQSLTQKLRELEKMNRFMVDRELRMAELKAQLKRLGPDVLSNP